MYAFDYLFGSMAGNDNDLGAITKTGYAIVIHLKQNTGAVHLICRPFEQVPVLMYQLNLLFCLWTSVLDIKPVEEATIN